MHNHFLRSNNAAISGIARKCSSMYSVRLPSPAMVPIAFHTSSESCTRRGRLGVLYTVGRPIFLFVCTFISLSVHLLNNGFPGTEADWSADGAFTSIYLIPYYSAFADFKNCGAGLVRPGAIPWANRDYCTAFNLAVNLCYCHFRSPLSYFVPPWYTSILTYLYIYVKRFYASLGQFLDIHEKSLVSEVQAHA